MFWNVFRKAKMPLVQSSRKWRELYAPQLFELFASHLEVQSINEMYSLLFFLANDKNLNDSIGYINKKNYNELQRMCARVPMDIDEVDYPLYDLVYIVEDKGQHIGIVFDDGKSSIKNTTLHQLISCDKIDLTKFLGRRLIHPV